MKSTEKPVLNIVDDIVLLLEADQTTPDIDLFDKLYQDDNMKELLDHIGVDEFRNLVTTAKYMLSRHIDELPLKVLVDIRWMILNSSLRDGEIVYNINVKHHGKYSRDLLLSRIKDNRDTLAKESERAIGLPKLEFSSVRPLEYKVGGK